MNNDELVRRYQNLYRQKTGKDLPEDEALSQALKLVTLVGAIYNPLSKRKDS